MPAFGNNSATIRRRSKVGFAYAGISLFLWMVLLGLVSLGGIAGHSDGGEGTPLHQVPYLVAFAIAFFATRPWARLRNAFVMPFSLAVALGWCWFSVSWAIDPSASARRLFLTTIVIWTTFALVQELGYARSVLALRVALGVTLLVSFLLIAFVPSIGIQPVTVVGGAGDAGGWRGVMIDKNGCGAFSAIVVMMFSFDGRAVPRYLRVLAIAAALILLAGSGSKTSIGVLIAIFPIAWLISRYNPTYRIMLIPVAMCVAVGLFLVWPTIISPFKEALYDPTAFTGRGLIWSGLVSYIKDHPLLGAGFGSFWAIGPASPILKYSPYDWVQKIYQGHNGYLDLWTQIGIPGLILVIVAVFILPLIKILIDKKLRRDQAGLIAGVILFCLGNNFTESTLLNRDSLLNVLLMFAIALSRYSYEVPVGILDANHRTAKRIRMTWNAIA